MELIDREALSREIVFRGKGVHNREWLEGNLLIDALNGIHKIVVLHNHVFGITEMYTVSPSTVGQYTGLTDKQGVKIFEGDIVEYQFDNDDETYPSKRTEKRIGRIFYSEWRASFSVTAGRNGSDRLNNNLFSYVRNGNRVKVIGNIHDNPELIGGCQDV